MSRWPSREEFWSGKRVMVTGGGGFLGSLLVKQLETLDLQRLVVPRSQAYDLRDPRTVQKLLQETRPELVIHLAASVGGIGANRTRPAEIFYDNLMMGVPLVHHCYHQGVDKFVGVGTVCSYPNDCPVPFKEEDLWEGYPDPTNAPYGLAKKMLLVAAQAYRQQYDFNAVTLLPVNLYGPGDDDDPVNSHVIPALIRKATEARDEGRSQLQAWGSGKATREFLYVEDAAEAILLACERYDSPEPVNLGSGREISIKDLTTLIGDLCGFRGEIVWDTSKPDGQPRRCLDVSRARERFGFQAETDFEEGLLRTVKWFQERWAQQKFSESL